MKIVAVVPMKLNNQRLPQKNTKKFKNGNPLCTYVLSTLMQVSKLDDVYVYCSNPDIKQYLPDGVKYLQRSKELDLDSTTMNEVLIAFAKEVDADVYLMTHATAPFISVASMVEGLKMVCEDIYDSAFSVKKVQDFLWKDGKPYNYDLTNIPRTQDLPILYQETSGFYIYHKDVIINMRRRIGECPYMVEVGEIESVDIDEMEDFEIADAIYNYKKF